MIALTQPTVLEWIPACSFCLTFSVGTRTRQAITSPQEPATKAPVDVSPLRQPTNANR